MANMIEKKFKNVDLGVEITSYIDKQQNIFFKGKDVAQILGYSNTKKAVLTHVDSEDKQLICWRPQNGTGNNSDLRGKYFTFINESGFYSLVLSSKLETAKKFKRWVTSEVLPAIRKFGYYKLFDSKIKQRVITDGKKYYKHPVFSNYAANKNGEVINVKTVRNIKMSKVGSGYLKFTICNKKLEKRKDYLQHRFVFEVFKGPIPRFFEIDHRNSIKTDNRIKNLQILTHKKNVEKSKNKPIISINIENGKERRFNSIKAAAIELVINYSSITNICCQRKYYKSATSKKDGCKYTFKFTD